jgi:hypothetical protein
MKLKRKPIAEQYVEVIERLYDWTRPAARGSKSYRAPE